MERLWNFPRELQTQLIELALHKHGTICGEMSSPHSSIYTFDQGAGVVPQYIVAKGIQVNDSMSENEKYQFFYRALHEVNSAHRVCHHPLVQRFFDVAVIHGAPFLLSKKRDANLRDVISEGPISEVEAISIAIQIVHGLIYCANKGLECHQDLKPENIFIDYIADHFRVPPDYPLRCRTFIADFELANAYRMLGHPYGSRPYMAPEQYHTVPQGEPLRDFSKVDVFALGVILYEMLTGGAHPIGEHTSQIWPRPSKEKGNKWLRENPWKKWIKRGAQINSVGSKPLDPELINIIQDCLEPASTQRISRDDLEERLNTKLQSIDEHAHANVSVILSEFDQLAQSGEEAGWPHYAERVAKLNSAFSDLS